MKNHSNKPHKLMLINPMNLLFKEDIAFNQYTVYEPLGLEIVAAYTPEHWDIEILDENFSQVSFKNVDLVGLTSFTSNAHRAYEIATIFRDKGITTVMGGIHASMLPEEALQYVDTVAIGEAESVWEQLISDFESDNLKKKYKGELPDMKSHRLPRRDLVKADYIYASVQTSRGCPMDCAFCSVSAFNGKKYRLRPVDEILEELESIQSQRIFFVDDNILGYTKETREHAMDLFRGMIKNGLKKDWYSQASMNFAENAELVKLAAQSGCRMILLGIETEKTEDLHEMNKGLNLKIGVRNYRSVFRRMHRQGICILGSFIFGMENDTVEDLYRREKYITRCGVDAFQTTILTPLPGTRVFEKMVQENRLIKNDFPSDWKHYQFYELVMKPKLISPNEFLLAMARIWKRMYSSRNLRIELIKTFFKCWNFNPFRWARRGLNAALWGFYTNHLTYKRLTEQYMVKPDDENL